MGIFRTRNEPTVTFYQNKQSDHQFENNNEWVDEQANLGLDSNTECRIDIDSWQHRYEYENRILSPIIQANNFTKIIELGSGPGALGQKIIENTGVEDYTFIDQPGAAAIHKNRKFKGNFKVIDLMNSFDTSELDKDYDFLITNDFLEHIYNPSIVVQNCYKIIKPKGKMFVSVPNWRMGHTFIYRGLFDFDNFAYFMLTHGFDLIKIFDSPIKCQYSPKISSESEMDDRLITSWNWYMLFEKID
jgi:2-polyprenyl-3-methyl-5-hydroxy-6-metoxy-1,4-benzoquinol methylase